MINKFFSFFISIFLIIVIISPIIVNSIDSNLIEIKIENNEEEKENKTELSQEYETDYFLINTHFASVLNATRIQNEYDYKLSYSHLVFDLTSPPPEATLKI